MTALTAARATLERKGDNFSFPLAASTKVYQGSIACLNSSGYATKGAVSTTLVCVGIFIDTFDNSAGAAGDIKAEIKRGVFQFENSASADLIELANIGSNCYIVDDNTVALTNGTGTRSKCGVIRDVDSNGVWVEI